MCRSRATEKGPESLLCHKVGRLLVLSLPTFVCSSSASPSLSLHLPGLYLQVWEPLLFLLALKVVGR